MIYQTRNPLGGCVVNIYSRNGALYIVPRTNLISDGISYLRESFLGAIRDNSERTVVLDVNGVDVVDSMGVNLIIGLYRELDATSRTLQIINAGEKFMKVADFFKFSSLFTISTIT